MSSILDIKELAVFKGNVQRANHPGYQYVHSLISDCCHSSKNLRPDT